MRDTRRAYPAISATGEHPKMFISDAIYGRIQELALSFALSQNVLEPSMEWASADPIL